jgi:hypothetical protein
LARRYGSTGTFWRGRADPGFHVVAGWQIWNEPNHPKYWAPAPNTGGYVGLLRRTRAAILNGDPSARIVLAGVSEHHTRPPIASFVSEVYAAGGRDLFDIVSLHPYYSEAKDVERPIKEVRAVMRENGDERKPMWVTELGWATAGPRGHDLIKTPREHAQLLRTSFSRLRARARRYRIEVVMWFNWRDREIPPGEQDRIDAHMGLFEVDGFPKPAWRSFVEIAGGSTGIGPLLPEPEAG